MLEQIKKLNEVIANESLPMSVRIAALQEVDNALGEPQHTDYTEEDVREYCEYLDRK